jgi:hypothetical protein
VATLPTNYTDAHPPTGALSELPATTSRGLNAITGQINTNTAAAATNAAAIATNAAAIAAVVVEAAAGTGTMATDTSAVQAALTAVTDGGTVRLRRGSSYNISALTLSGKSVTLDGNGATLVASANSTALTLAGGWDWTRTVSAISEVTWNAVQTTRLTVSAVTSLAVGDVVRLVADDTLPFSRPNPPGTEVCRTGEYAVVGEIDAGNNYVYLTGVVRETFTTTMRVAKLSKKQIKIRDLTLDITDAGYTAGYNQPMIEVQAAWQPILENVRIKRGYAMGVVMRGCYAYRIDNLCVDWLPNETVVYRRGYGICDISSEYGVVSDMTAGTCRHAFTTATDVVAVSTDPMSYGRSAHAHIIGGTCVGSSHSGWDTHEDAFDVVFSDCVTVGAYAGVTGAGAGFTLRGRNCGFVRCKALNCQYGFYPSTQFVSSTNGIVLDRCEAIGCTNIGLYPNADVGMQVQNLTVIGGVYEGRVNAMYAIRADVKLVGRPMFRVIPSPTPLAAVYAVRAATSSNLTADSLDIDLSQSNATDSIAMRIESSSTAVGVDNGEVFGGANPIFRVWHGASTPGAVYARGWVLSAAPTNPPTGFTINNFEWRVRGNLTVGSGRWVPPRMYVTTSAGTTTLDKDSMETVVLSGATTHTVKLPTTGILAGQVYTVIDDSTGIVSVQASDASAILSILGGRSASFEARIDTPVASTDWDIKTVTVTTGTGGSPVTGAVLLRDTNGNAAADNFIPLGTSTTSAAGTLTMDINSRQCQQISGTQVHTIKLPTTGVTFGQIYIINNQSTQTITVQSSGANTIDTIATLLGRCYQALKTSPTAAADWRSF